MTKSDLQILLQKHFWKSYKYNFLISIIDFVFAVCSSTGIILFANSESIYEY